jgi:hypothetical protein
MPVLEPDRALLNPKFEAYRLAPFDEATALARTALAVPATPTGLSGRAPLALAQVRARVRHNHLAVERGGTRALFVDAARRVCVVELDVRRCFALYARD